MASGQGSFWACEGDVVCWEIRLMGEVGWCWIVKDLGCYDKEAGGRELTETT